jgi:outer membrane protein assembly factor BamD (BamD/ComL family)
MPQNDNLYIEASIFHSEETGEYVTRFNTTEGPATAPFDLLADTDIAHELAALREGIARSFRGRTLRTGPEANRPRAFGKKLFNALFTGQGLQLYRACRRRLEESSQVDQRLVMKINPTTYELANLPWELLCDPEKGSFCAFDRCTPVIRFIPDCPARRPTFDEEWRILLVASNPSDTPELNLEGEMQEIEVAFHEVAPHVKLRIEDLLAPTPKDFRRALRDFDPHILHFMGHGSAGCIFLENVGQGAVAVRESNLALTLKNIPALRLVFLNACETATAESEQNLGLAYAISQAGIPAVVANQFSAEDTAAREMSNEFYRVLVSGMPVDEAVLWGRIALQARATLEWATPVLYLQSPDGNLFKDLLQRQSSPREYEYDVFISYSHVDQEWVRGELLPQLEKAGLRVIIDYRDFEIGAPALVNMERAVDNSRHTLLVMTPDWVESAWAEFEGLLAGTGDPAARRRKLIPLALKPCSVPNRIAMLTYANFMNPARRSEEMARLVKSLGDRGPASAQSQADLAAAPPAWPEGQSERAHALQEQLVLHGRNLDRLEKQRAQSNPLLMPTYILEQIASEQAEIARLEEELAKSGGEVQPSAPPPAPKPPESAVNKTATIEPDPQLLSLYESAEMHFKNREWDAAIGLLEDIIHAWPTYRKAESMLQTARHEREQVRLHQLHDQRLTALLNGARAHWEEGQKGEKGEWQKALGLLEEVLIEAPDFANGEALRLQRQVKDAYDAYLKDQQTHRKLQTLYNAAQQAIAEESWGRAIPLLQSVVEADAQYQDAAQLLQTATREAHLAALYEQGNLAYQDRNWAEAVEHFGNIQSLAEAYRDVPRKLADARQQLRWDKLYDEGVAYLEREDWDNAVEVLSQATPDKGRRRGQPRDLSYALAMQAYTQAMKRADQKSDTPADWEATSNILKPIVDDSPGYRDAAHILQEAQRQARWAKLYGDGRQAAQAKNWAVAIQAFETITRENSAYRDAWDQGQEARRQQRLAEHYEKGGKYLEWKSWREAREELQAVLGIDPNYLDAPELAEKADREIHWAELYSQALQDYAANDRSAAIASLGRVVAEKSDYRGGEAASLLKEWQKETRIRQDYDQGKLHIQQKKWRAAVASLEHLFATEPAGYLDAGVELEKARLEVRLEELFTEARGSMDDQQWDRAIPTLKEIQALRAAYRGVASLLGKAEEESWLAARYQQACQSQATEQWDKAIEAFEDIRRSRQAYADVDDRLQEAQLQRRLAGWYAEANQAIEAKEWGKAVGLFEKIRQQSAADYKDVALLYSHAERNRQLAALYDQALAALSKSDWGTAEQALVAAAQLDEGYRDVQVKLAEARRQKRLLSLYNQAQAAETAGHWEEAIALYRQVVDMDEDYRDTARRLPEAELQKTLAGFYAVAEEAAAKKDWSKAALHYEAILVKVKDYRDVKDRLAEVRKLQQIDSHYQSAVQLESEGKLAGALENYQAILAIDRTFDDVAAKVEELTKAIELEKLYQEAQAFLQQQRFIDGIPLLQAIMKRDPKYKDVQAQLNNATQAHHAALLGKYQHAQKLKTEGRLKEAREELEAYQREKTKSSWL